MMVIVGRTAPSLINAGQRDENGEGVQINERKHRGINKGGRLRVF